MVVFTCQNCGESLKKAVVEKHYYVTKCRYKTPHLTCVDCLKDFFDQEYNAHIECVTEAERYSAKGTVFKQANGKMKQKKYVSMIQNVLNSKDLTRPQREILEMCSNFDNVPRKEKKFLNFMKNLGNKWNVSELQVVFKLLEESWASEVENTGISVATNNEKIDNESKNTSDDLNKTDKNPKDQQIKQESFEISEENNGQSNKTNDNIDELKENAHSMSRKALKKQKKREKYLAQLENDKNNIGCEMELEETVTESSKNNKKSNKSKRIKVKTDEKTLYSNNIIEHVDAEKNVKAMEINKQQRKVSKKEKKRKLHELESEVPEKKNKFNPPEEEEVEAQATFDWAEVIVSVLQSRPDKELSLKRLGKKVVNEYQTVKPDHHSYEQLLAKFNKKVMKTSGVRVLKDKAKLIE